MFRLHKAVTIKLLIVFSIAFSFETIEFFALKFNDNLTALECLENNAEKKENEKGKEKEFFDELFFENQSDALTNSGRQFDRDNTMHLYSDGYGKVIYTPPDLA
ncbi:MAG TPA: hypothetical protein VI731_03570 [Bacteroidia bacterium]|nr:hypothetical protein [Bacteroidia bacterium]